jgi:hypothetical protein
MLNDSDFLGIVDYHCNKYENTRMDCNVFQKEVNNAWKFSRIRRVDISSQKNSKSIIITHKAIRDI